MLFWLLTTLSMAQSQAHLVDGETLLQPCLERTECGDALLGLVSENMTEYGFVQQVDPIATSALAGRGVGLVAEIRVDSTTMGHKNQLEETILIPPILPRVSLGYQYGSYTYDNPYPQYALGLTVLPPVPVLGGTLFSADPHASFAVPLGTHVIWAGLDVGYGYSQLALPLLGTEAQLALIPELDGHLPTEGAMCTDIGEGCLDQFQQHAAHARVGLSIEPVAAAFLYMRGGVTYLRQTLHLAYDDSRWAIEGVQPQGGFGGGIRAGDKYQLALGGTLASRPLVLSTDESSVIAKVVFSTSFRFGNARYWERAEAE